MSSTPEGKLKAQVKELLTSIPSVWYFMPVPTGFGVRGIPDFLGCWQGRFFAIETKAPGKKETPWQTRVRLQILAAGGLAIVTDKFEDVLVVFKGVI